MYRIEVRAADDSTLIFTVTDRSQAPWGPSNTTILVPPEQLAPLVDHLQQRLHTLQQQQRAAPAFARGQTVAVVGGYRQGQGGTVIEVREKDARLQQRTGARWSYTVAFADGSTWSYQGDELAPRA